MTGRRVAAAALLVGAVSLGAVAASRPSSGPSDRPVVRATQVQLPTAPDAWERVVLPGGAPGCLDMGCMVRSIAASDAGLVATGSWFTPDERFVGWSSSDGLSWQQIDGDGARDAEGLAAGATGFFAARHADIYTSTDGVAWTPISPPGVGAGIGDPQVLSVSAGGPGLVAVGSPGRAWFSSDGVAWKAADVPPTKQPTDMTAVATGAGRLVATGVRRFGPNRAELEIWVSSDGTSWRDVAIDGHSFSPQCRITGLVGDRDGFVATGWCGRVDGGKAKYHVWRSDDGVGWTQVGGDRFDPRYVAVGVGPMGFLAVDAHGVWISSDGRSWTSIPSPKFQRPVGTGVTTWGSRVVIVGSPRVGRNVVWISGPQS